MTPERDDTLLPLIRRIAAGSAAGVADSELLRRFLNQRDEAAFELLVRRHGPMVLAVCRRVLGRLHDAEDAFQATFLVLARKAAEAAASRSVAAWLHGVASRTALKARTTAARWRRWTVIAREGPTSAAPTEPEADWQPLLDEELRRLPEK